jgi:opacity protein-like surface antigen
MKKIILTVAAVFVLSFTNAQEKSSEGLASGDLVLTGAFNFSSSSTGNAKTDDLKLSPGLIYMLSDNIAVIGQLDISSGKTPVAAPGTEIKTSGFGVAAGVKYFLTPASKFSVSVGAQVAYGSAKTDNGTVVTKKTTAFTVPLGLHYFVSNNFAITSSWGGLTYSSNDNGGGAAEKTSVLGLKVDMSSISFGLAYKL